MTNQKKRQKQYADRWGQKAPPAMGIFGDRETDGLDQPG